MLASLLVVGREIALVIVALLMRNLPSDIPFLAAVFDDNDDGDTKVA